MNRRDHGTYPLTNLYRIQPINTEDNFLAISDFYKCFLGERYVKVYNASVWSSVCLSICLPRCHNHEKNVLDVRNHDDLLRRSSNCTTAIPKSPSPSLYKRRSHELKVHLLHICSLSRYKPHSVKHKEQPVREICQVQVITMAI